MAHNREVRKKSRINEDVARMIFLGPQSEFRPRCSETNGDADVADGGTAVLEAPPKTRRDTRTRPSADESVETLPPWRVLLHNDDVNDMEYVTQTISALTPLSLKVAVHCMLEAHLRGLTLLLVTHQERAELYRDQFHTKSLTVTIEAVEAG